jgi:hypothetical protein
MVLTFRSFWLASTLLAVACATPEERLADKKRTLHALEDDLYARYGGSDIASGIDREARKADAQVQGAGGLGSMVANLVRDADRAWLLEGCALIAAGERPPALTDASRAFFQDPATIDSCTQWAKLQKEVAELEKVAAAPRAN